MVYLCRPLHKYRLDTEHRFLQGFDNRIHTDATPFSSAATFGQGAGLIALNNVACTAYESRLIDCPYTNSTAGCSHANDVGANCSSRM